MMPEQVAIKCAKYKCVFAEKIANPELIIDEKFCSLSQDYKDYLKKNISNCFKYINTILLCSGGLAGVVILSKIYGVAKFKFGNIEIPINDSWIIFSILTVAHIYFGLNMMKVLRMVESVECDKIRKEIYTEITSSENIFISGLNPRPILTRAVLKAMLADFDKRDLTYWFRLVIHVGIFIAILDFSNLTVLDFIIVKNERLAVAFLIAVTNSFFGSYYLANFYKLAYSKRRGLGLVGHFYD